MWRSFCSSKSWMRRERRWSARRACSKSWRQYLNCVSSYNLIEIICGGLNWRGQQPFLSKSWWKVETIFAVASNTQTNEPSLPQFKLPFWRLTFVAAIPHLHNCQAISEGIMLLSYLISSPPKCTRMANCQLSSQPSVYHLFSIAVNQEQGNTFVVC
jgi:hypothetical protein